MSRLDAAAIAKLVSTVAALQQEHREHRERVAPADMLTQVKQRDGAFESVTVGQVRRAITKANEMKSTMDVDESHATTIFASPYADLPIMFGKPQEPPPNWAEHRERLGLTAGFHAKTFGEECEEWRAGRARRHSV